MGLFIPDPVAKHDRLSPIAKMAFGVLYRYARGADRCQPSVGTIGERLGLKERQTRDYIRELEAAGFIAIERGRREANTYVFLWHADFDDPAFSFGIPGMNQDRQSL